MNGIKSPEINIIFVVNGSSIMMLREFNEGIKNEILTE